MPTAPTWAATPADIELTYNCKIVIRDSTADARAILDAQLAANAFAPGAEEKELLGGYGARVCGRLADSPTSASGAHGSRSSRPSTARPSSASSGR